MSDDIKSFDDLLTAIAEQHTLRIENLEKSSNHTLIEDQQCLLEQQANTIARQNKSITQYKAKNYSLLTRNKFLIRCNRALYICLAIVLTYILLAVVVGG